MIAFFDGERTDDHPVFAADARAVAYGDGVFETMRAYGGRVFSLAEHLARLEKSAAWARLRAPSKELAVEIAQVAALGGDCAVRAFIVRRDAEGALADASVHRIVTASNLPLVMSSATAIVARTHEGVRTSAKYARYLPNLLARDDARNAGADEAFFCNAEGNIIEGATSNVFAVLGGSIVTAPAEGAILAGITRAYTLALAARAGFRIALEPIAKWNHASEVFITSSLREIVPIVAIDGTPIGDGKPGPVATRLLADYRALTSLTE